MKQTVHKALQDSVPRGAPSWRKLSQQGEHLLKNQQQRWNLWHSWSLEGGLCKLQYSCSSTWIKSHCAYYKHRAPLELLQPCSCTDLSLPFPDARIPWGPADCSSPYRWRAAACSCSALPSSLLPPYPAPSTWYLFSWRLPPRSRLALGWHWSQCPWHTRMPLPWPGTTVLVSPPELFPGSGGTAASEGVGLHFRPSDLLTQW